ncbi:MAG TPA: class II fructose-bisphosphate aldolase [Cytophagaceae bacterium]|jgi:ketose-bisphosphate aldolase|nr:class II fructose-bisphosphate aldolase [Cytophagaceae bacterium]
MKLQDKFKKVREAKSAILATNFYNYETLKGVLTAAKITGSPIILQLTQSSIDYMTMPVALSMARAAIKEYNVEAWIHLDHGGSIDLAKSCLDAGFDSVMIDASEEPIGKNIEITKQVVKYAQSYNASVEAELGYIAKLGQDKAKLGFTEPADAKRFVDETGVNALAISIGSAHGFYTREPKLDMERLSAIREITDVALVLHGSSGIPHDQLQEAVNRGIAKINLATEIKNMFMMSLKEILSNNDEIDLRKVFPKATDRVIALVKEKLEVVKNSTVAI